MGDLTQVQEQAQKVDILLVDDQPEGLLALEAILGGLGQNLVRANSGREALRQILARDFAVILLDVQMPGMDGYETAALIRERPASQHTPLIFLTASHTADVQMIRGYGIGAVDYLFKPLDANVLRSKVAVFIELAKKSAVIHKQTAAIVEREAEARRLAEARAQLLVDLEQKNHELEAVNKELEAFSYSVSHDLRAPLRSVDGFSLIVLEDYGEKLDEEGRQHLRYIRESAQAMALLIDDLLALSLVTRGEFQRQPVDLTGIARTVAESLRAQQPERRIEFVIADGLAGEGDARLMAIVLQNLIGNAWKYSGKRAEPRIEVGAIRSNRGVAYFVRDNGAGFDMAYADKLFGVFQRLHSAEEFEGTGIGLATVERIIRRHGGHIWAEAEVDRGATFFFTLAGGPLQQGVAA